MKKLLLILAFISVQLSFAQNEENRGYRVNVGETPPNLDFELLDGTGITNENLKGKVVVLQFTASWCGPCRKEMPHLEKEVWQRYKNDAFILIGIDLKETPQQVAKFIKKTKVTYPFTIDTNGELFESFTLPKAGVTRNIVLNKEGKIIFLSRLYDKKEFARMVKVIQNELND